ncbi:MAG: hypothetical protein V3V08_21655 [Nannocystaceae bacterium]
MFFLTALALGLLQACRPTTSLQQSEGASTMRFIGGWDGTQTRGNSVLLLREDYRGTVSSSIFGYAEKDYRLAYEVAGEVSEDGEFLSLELLCTEANMVTLSSAEAAEADEGATGGVNEGAGPMSQWNPIDCTGWALSLLCTLAGDCESGGGCNMVCDITQFGEAYALSGAQLKDVEAEFDFWERV